MSGRQKGKYSNYSISRSLKIAGKSSEEFEVMLGQLTLEEIIALKLEISAKMINNKLYGLELWKAIPRITKDALLKFAVSAAQTQQDACRILGIKPAELRKLKDIYNFENYFEK
tara:strand:- start:10377 stop:10718 length:342 start_codon:yes stop_codon:yes gene_type:complete